jgi:hypothetical protein
MRIDEFEKSILLPEIGTTDGDLDSLETELPDLAQGGREVFKGPPRVGAVDKDVAELRQDDSLW